MNNPGPKYITEEEILGALTFEEVLEEVKQAYIQQWEFPELNLPRARIRFESGIYHTMSAYSRKYGIAGSKYYLTVKNAEPAFKMSVFDTTTGNHFLFDADFIGRLRTAASTILAINKFAPRAREILLIGAGRQGSMHLEFLRLVPAVEQVRIFSKTAEKADKLAADAGSLPRSFERGLPPFHVEAYGKLDDALKRAETVILTTYSKEPILLESHLHDKLILICAIGANYESRAEVAPEVFLRAKLIVVDDTETAQTEGADIGRAINKLYIQWKNLIPFGETLSKNIAHPEGLVIFKSYGINILDIAVAGLYLKKKKLID